MALTQLLDIVAQSAPLPSSTGENSLLMRLIAIRVAQLGSDTTMGSRSAVPGKQKGTQGFTMRFPISLLLPSEVRWKRVASTSVRLILCSVIVVAITAVLYAVPLRD